MIEYPLNYYTLVYAHLATILPAFAIGTYMMIRRKGSTQHKFLGKIYLLLMLITASIALFIPAFAGPRLLLNHFGLIHLLCVLTIYTCPAAYIAIKKGETKKTSLFNDLSLCWWFNNCRIFYANAWALSRRVVI